MAYNILVVLFAALSTLFGTFVVRYPQKTIEIQKEFYALINWRVEPIDLEKEIRNTRIMGGFLLIFTLATCAYIYLW